MTAVLPAVGNRVTGDDHAVAGAASDILTSVAVADDALVLITLVGDGLVFIINHRRRSFIRRHLLREAAADEVLEMDGGICTSVDVVLVAAAGDALERVTAAGVDRSFADLVVELGTVAAVVCTSVNVVLAAAAAGDALEHVAAAGVKHAFADLVLVFGTVAGAILMRCPYLHRCVPADVLELAAAADAICTPTDILMAAANDVLELGAAASVIHTPPMPPPRVPTMT
ncbi:hypothetical protein E2562_028745 [Oryza meyeriana var. granulata]|uniref:Uncharacterized protein n=1 Tax=Oryza meyeriana var. granulata TaxID=110450 RepID=A0A6G1D9Q2_9ORYZ|nr:hypothetical protein E2562_028745 [Oryza meyeriana var. granulata]